MRSFAVTAKNVVRYFLLHGNNAQLKWLINSMTALPLFRVNEECDVGPQIEACYTVNEPVLDWEPEDIQAQFDRRLWYLLGGCKFGKRNDLLESDAEEDMERIYQRPCHQANSRSKTN